MSTAYILPRDRKVIVHQVKHNLSVVVSEDDEAKGLTVASPDVDLGIANGGEYAWISFYSGEVTCLNVYGGSGEGAIDLFEQTFNVKLISEHDDDFPYHNFPVDVHTAPVYASKDNWRLYQCGDFVYLYDAKNNSFYAHVCERVNEYNFDHMIAEATC